MQQLSNLIIVFVVLYSGVATAATYYVDYVSGADTNNGTSTSTPWKRCPGDDNASDNSLATTLTGSDTVVFKGGVPYDGRIDLDDDGTSAESRIIYDGNSDGTWGTGKAVIDGNNSYNRSFSGTNVNYVTIKNFELRDVLHSLNDSRAIKIDGFDYLTIQDCYIHDIGNYSPSATVQGTGIYLLNGSNALVTGNDITEVGNSGIFLWYVTDSVISNNSIHDYINWAIGASGLSADVTISDNRIYNLYRFDDGYWLAGGDPPHSNGIFLYEYLTDFPKRFTIERNIFYNNETFDEFGGSYMINTSNGNEGLIIRNNVFINAHSYYVVGLRESSQTDDCEIYNNTIYSPRTTAFLIGPTNGHFKIKNNAVVANRWATYLKSSADYANADWDYNYYATEQANTDIFKEDAASRTLAYVQANWNGGIEANSVEVNGKSDFLFVDESGYPTSCDTMNLSLQADSPLVGSGVDLSVNFTTDKDGIVRGTTWDIGAYEFEPPPPHYSLQSGNGSLKTGNGQFKTR